MKALILRGSHKGKILEVHQNCNDWFMLKSDDIKIATKPFTPSSLSFTFEDIKAIMDSKGNGLLLAWFEVVPVPTKKLTPLYPYTWTFKKK